MTDKWVNIDAGPRQIKDLQSAINALTREGQSQDEITGVRGGKEHTFSTWSPFGVTRPEAVAADEAIRARYAYKITRKNVREIAAAYLAAVPELRKSRPVEDNRREPEEDAAIQARIAEREAGYAAKRDAEQSLMDQVTAKAPPWARALIIAQYNVDNSDPMTDYFSNQTTRTVAIGWRSGSREDFRQLHRAAAAFTETAGITFEERRDNYSMGKGNYLSDHGWDGAGSGWVVKSYPLPARWVSLTEDALPDEDEQARQAAVRRVEARGRQAAAEGETGLEEYGWGDVTVSPGTRPGYVEVRFGSKPAEEVRAGLKAHGFRWARSSGSWYGRDEAYARSLAAECCGDCKGGQA